MSDSTDPTGAPNGGGLRISDAAALRAIAHPLRQRILLELKVLGHARAADLARQIGRPANAISFHLRVLARAGIIVEAPELARDKRDRVWRVVAGEFEVDPDLPGVDLAVQPYLQWLRWLFGHAGEVNRGNRGLASMQSRDGLFTREEVDQLITEMGELVDRWHRRALEASRAGRDADRTYHQIFFAVGPTDPGTDDEPVAADHRSSAED